MLMETGFEPPICNIIKRLTGKLYQCHKLIGINEFEACPFGHCIDDDIEDATRIYSDKVIKLLNQCLRKRSFRKWLKKV